MQGQRRTIGSFPGIVSMMQGPSSSGTDMNHQSSLNHVQNAVDFRLSDYRGSSGETACLRGNGHNVQSFSGWNTGESSSRLTLINQVNDEDLKSEHGLSSSCNAITEGGVRSEEQQFEPNNIIFPVSSNTSLQGNQSRVHPSFLQGSSSNHINQNISLHTGHIANTADRGKGKEAGSSVNDNNTSGLDREKTLFGNASCNHIGTSSESSGYMTWGDSASSSSLVNWGPSCKRKALEGSSRQLCTGGSSSTLVQSENGCWPAYPVDLNASSSLSDSMSLEDIPVTSPPLLHNTRSQVRQETSNAFPLISGEENMERPQRNFDRRMSQLQHQESVPLNLPSTGSARHHNHTSLHQIPSSHSINDSLELRLTAGVTASNSSAALSQSPTLRIHSFPWNRTSANPRGARSSTSYNYGERSVREDFNLRMFPRDSTEHPMNVPASSGHEPTGWHTPSGNVNNSGGVPPTPWIGSNSNVHPSSNPSWIFNHEVPADNMQGVSEFSPWSLFPSISSASGVHNGHSNPAPSGPPSFTQGSSSNQSHLRTALLMERRGGDVLSGGPHSLRAVTFDNEGRRRLISEIRQVLMAMRRGESLRAEDYMLFDPFIYHGMSEMHDRHREMRLDVDNMSYEELLALEERIGDVSTGLGEDLIVKLMKQRIYMSVMTESSTDLEPCCICQEEFGDGENVGSLDCGHEFHSGCIKQWLMQKNLCPICKTTALAT